MNTRKIQKLVKFIRDNRFNIYYNGSYKHMIGQLEENASCWVSQLIPDWYIAQEKCKVTHNPNEVVLCLGHDLEWVFEITEEMLHNATVSKNGEKLILTNYDNRGRPQKHYLSFPMQITVNKKIK
jgi:hypothetical protein